MKAKKIWIIFAAVVLVALIAFELSQCMRKPAEAPTDKSEITQQDETQTDEESTAQQYLSDMLSDTYYRGRVTEITDDEITIILDEIQPYTFKLSDDARKDIEVLKIAVDNRVIVTFDTAEDGTLTATKIDVVTSE